MDQIPFFQRNLSRRGGSLKYIRKAEKERGDVLNTPPTKPRKKPSVLSQESRIRKGEGSTEEVLLGKSEIASRSFSTGIRWRTV